jgi:hypothetical protein
MQHDAAPVRPLAMFEQVNALPGSQRQLAFVDWNRQLRLRERRADMRGHVIRTLRRVPVQARVFRDQAGEEIGQVGHHIGIGVFLNHQRSRGVLAEDGQEAGLGFVPMQPALDLSREIVQSFAARRDMNLVSELLHSLILFHRHALGEIARLIHIATPAHGNVIRQQLQRHDFQDRQ